jgi:hypothetical protein
MAPVTSEELAALLGEVDDLVIERIVATGASLDEVAAALGGIEDERNFGEELHSPTSGRTAMVRRILDELLDEPDEEHELPIQGDSV